MKRTQILIVNAIAFFSLVAVVMLWQHPLWLFLSLSVLLIGSLMVSRSKQIVVLAILGAVLGPMAEIVAVHSGAWSYALADVLGVPFWLFPLWGLAGVYIAQMAQLLDRS